VIYRYFDKSEVTWKQRRLASGFNWASWEQPYLPDLSMAYEKPTRQFPRVELKGMKRDSVKSI
jgi:hypothetical protein